MAILVVITTFARLCSDFGGDARFCCSGCDDDDDDDGDDGNGDGDRG